MTFGQDRLNSGLSIYLLPLFLLFVFLFCDLLRHRKWLVPELDLRLEWQVIFTL